MDAVRALRQDGIDAIYGDATRLKRSRRPACAEPAA